MKILTVLIGLTAMVCAKTSAPIGARTTDPDLRVSIARDGSKPHEIFILLTNGGTIPLWVNKRCAVGGENQSATDRELVIAVVDANGKREPHLCRTRISSPKDDDYGTFAPGETIRTAYDVARCFPGVRVGNKSIEVRFQDGRLDPPLAPSGSIYAPRSANVATVVIKSDE
jgi:hypothetical protein